jgi:uncharacterized peroxidase-related enzyme
VIRLAMIEQGRGWRTLTLRPVLRWLFGQPIPGFVKVLLYRYRLFGKPIGRYGQAVLRGRSRWSEAERELFAALVSVENECAYCARLHGAIAERFLGACVVDDVLLGRAPDCAGPKVAAMVAFLRRLCRGPEQVAVGDVLALRRAGLEDDHIMEAVHVAVLLEICNRVVNALDVEPMGAGQNQRAATFLLRHGYR